MKKLAFLLLIPAAIVLFTSCNMAMGEDAVSAMTEQEKEFLAKIETITPEMSEAQVEKILGPVYRGAGTIRPVWLTPDKDRKSQVAVYYFDKKIFRVRWMKLGSFMWQKDFKT